MNSADHRPPSLTDVAKAAGVSRITASRILRGQGKHAEETVQRVRQVARDLGYRTNPHVSAAMEQVRRNRPANYEETLAFLGGPEFEIPHPAPHNHRLREGARRRAAELGYRIDFFLKPTTAAEGRRLEKVLHSRGIRGVIVATTPQPGEILHMPLDQFACAGTGPAFSGTVFLSTAASNSPQRMALALEKIGEHGYRKPALIVERSTEQRLGFPFTSQFLTHQHLAGESGSAKESPRILLLDCDVNSPEVLKKHVAPFLEKTRPDVVLAARRMIFLVIRELGYRAPEDLALVTLNWASGRDEPMAGTDQRSDAQGEALLDLVSSRLYRGDFGPAANPRTTLVNAHWRNGPSLPVRGLNRGARAGAGEPG